MAINPQAGQYKAQIGQSGQQAASALLQGGQQIGQAASNMQKSIPGAKQNFYTQAGNAIGAGQAQSGRGGASAYGGALQGGLQASQQAANFEISSGQALADMYAQQANMTSEGYATQAATAGQMLNLSNMNQDSLLQVNKQISDLISANTGTFSDNTRAMGVEFDRLISIYEQTGDAAMVSYLQGKKTETINFYSGYDG